MKKYLMVTLTIFTFVSLVRSQIKSPDEFLGFPLGADRKLADHNQIVTYFSTAG